MNTAIAREGYLHIDVQVHAPSHTVATQCTSPTRILPVGVLHRSTMNIVKQYFQMISIFGV